MEFFFCSVEVCVGFAIRLQSDAHASSCRHFCNIEERAASASHTHLKSFFSKCCEFAVSVVCPFLAILALFVLLLKGENVFSNSSHIKDRDCKVKINSTILCIDSLQSSH